jgi:hypothetical protein
VVKFTPDCGFPNAETCNGSPEPLEQLPEWQPA